MTLKRANRWLTSPHGLAVIDKAVILATCLQAVKEHENDRVRTDRSLEMALREIAPRDGIAASAAFATYRAFRKWLTTCSEAVVIPAKSGIQRLSRELHWVPACSGATTIVRKL